MRMVVNFPGETSLSAISDVASAALVTSSTLVVSAISGQRQGTILVTIRREMAKEGVNENVMASVSVGTSLSCNFTLLSSDCIIAVSAVSESIGQEI
jgi:hypothetical protein|tara:strand:+ start:1281 stop:1571 length:291 start_codon:yes stop_codon:yes gene_type:complete